MIGRLLCWLGLHDWHPTLLNWSSDEVRFWTETCDRCGAIGFSVERREGR